MTRAPVLHLACPDCGHEFAGSVFPGTKEPEVWVCSRCLGRRCAPIPAAVALAHPFDGHVGCGCCG